MTGCRNRKSSSRGIRLKQGFDAWKAERQGSSRVFPGLPYVALHGFSHLLLTAVALECGYPASSIRERIYAIPSVGYGVLLYTGSSDAEGTLGRADPGRQTHPQFRTERTRTRAALFERSGLRAARSGEQARASPRTGQLATVAF